MDQNIIPKFQQNKKVVENNGDKESSGQIKSKNQSSKLENFDKVATKRVQKILTTLKLLSNCANRNNYSFNEADIKKMMFAIKDQLKITEARFKDELNKMNNKKFNF